MFRHLLTSALFAGLAAGLLATILQLAFVVPLIFEGELYETGARLHFSATGSPQSPVGHPSIWVEPARHIGTFAMNLVTWSGFAFILIAGFALAERTGSRIDARTGAIWGLCGFIAIQLAPSDPGTFCGGMDLGYILDAMPWREALATVFKGSGECAKIDWTFLGFSMPMWTLVLYIGVLALAIYPAFRKS